MSSRQRGPSISLLSITKRRHRDVFPSGFDNLSSDSLDGQSGSYHSFDPDQLFHRLVMDYNPDDHVDHLLVTAAWYGKQPSSARHEFILVEVEDKKVPGLINYMILDRNPNRDQVFAGMTPWTRAGKALDAFRISYNGSRTKLLEECKLGLNTFLESLDFSTDHPLYFYELVTLVQQVSNQHPSYHLVTSSCYLFSGLVWECMRSMRPHATYDGELGASRGNFGYFRYKPKASEVEDIKTKVQEAVQGVKSTLEQLSSKVSQLPDQREALTTPNRREIRKEVAVLLKAQRQASSLSTECALGGTVYIRPVIAPHEAERDKKRHGNQLESGGDIRFPWVTWGEASGGSAALPKQNEKPEKIISTTQSDHHDLKSSQPMSHPEMVIMAVGQEDEPARLRGGCFRCCGWGISPTTAAEENNPGIQVKSMRPHSPQWAQQQAAPAASVDRTTLVEPAPGAEHKPSRATAPEDPRTRVFSDPVPGARPAPQSRRHARAESTPVTLRESKTKAPHGEQFQMPDLQRPARASRPSRDRVPSAPTQNPIFPAYRG